MNLDNNEVQKIQLRMQQCTKQLNDMAVTMGAAKQVREMASDRRKRALAIEMVKALKCGESATAADAIARASDGYGRELDEQGKQLAAAESTIAQWSATEASFEASRSLLSLVKATMNL